MKISNKLKKIIFKKLYQDLSKVEIIPHKNSIWFIDRDNKYWYFEYEKTGTLWWKHGFFKSFFEFFLIGRVDFEPILSEWVEEVLNCRVETTNGMEAMFSYKVEEVLNCRVETTDASGACEGMVVEEVLNCRVKTTENWKFITVSKVEEVLNCRVETTERGEGSDILIVEEVLNC